MCIKSAFTLKEMGQYPYSRWQRAYTKNILTSINVPQVMKNYPSCDGKCAHSLVKIAIMIIVCLVMPLCWVPVVMGKLWKSWKISLLESQRSLLGPVSLMKNLHDLNHDLINHWKMKKCVSHDIPVFHQVILFLVRITQKQ